MNRSIRGLAAACACVAIAPLLAGCEAMMTTDYDRTRPATADSGTGIVVVRLEAPTQTMSLWDAVKIPMVGVAAFKAADASGSQFTRAHPFDGKSDTYGTLTDGFAYIRLPASAEGERYVALMLRTNGNFMSTSAALTCKGRSAPSFVLKAGEVLYVGRYDLTGWQSAGYQKVSNRLRFQPPAESDFALIRNAHPELADVRAAALSPITVDYGADCS